jgi:hypothetical protein
MEKQSDYVKELFSTSDVWSVSWVIMVIF